MESHYLCYVTAETVSIDRHYVMLCFEQGSHSFTDKKSRTFPGLSRTSMRNFPGPFWSPRMLKYNEKPSPLPLTPVRPPPLEVGPFKSS